MELKERLKARLQITSDDEDVLLTELLGDAISLYATIRYPTSNCPTDEDGEIFIEAKYISWVLRCAVEMYSKMGGEGQIGHIELGVNRSFDSGTVSQSLLNEITPVCGVAQ